VPGLDDARRDLGQQRAVEQVVGGIDEHQVRPIRRQLALQATQGIKAGEASADHDHLRARSLDPPDSLALVGRALRAHRCPAEARSHSIGVVPASRAQGR
jgi:hypothetical protein